jgi:hypothetical protein
VIENGLVTLYVYERNGDDYTPYTGNDKNVTIDITIFNDMDGLLYPSAKATITVSFTNGNATFNCDSSSIVDLTPGMLTITGLTGYEGKRVYVDSTPVGGGRSIGTLANLRVIKNGSVTFPMYDFKEDKYTPYTGNEQNVTMDIEIILSGDGTTASPYHGIGFATITVSFTNGHATVAVRASDITTD